MDKHLYNTWKWAISAIVFIFITIASCSVLKKERFDPKMMIKRDSLQHLEKIKLIEAQKELKLKMIEKTEDVGKLVKSDTKIEL